MIDCSLPQGTVIQIVDVSGCCRVLLLTFHLMGRDEQVLYQLQRLPSPHLPSVRLPCGNSLAHITSLLFNAAVITPAYCNWTEI